MTYQEEFITFMVRSGVLTFGDFTTKSGRKTPYFVNTGTSKTGAPAARWRRSSGTWIRSSGWTTTSVRPCCPTVWRPIC